MASRRTAPGSETLDADRLRAAYARARPKLAEDPLLGSTKQAEAELRRWDRRVAAPPKTVTDLGAWLDGSDVVRYVGLAVLHAAFGRSAKPAKMKGDLHVGDETRVVFGDLHIEGNLTLDDGAMLLVLGSLTIDGFLAHVGDFSVIAAHDMTFASGVTTGELIALGRIDAGEKLYLAHNDHSCRARELRAGVLVDFERGNAFGKVVAKTRVTKWSFPAAARALGVAGDGELADEVRAALVRGDDAPLPARPASDEELWDAARQDADALRTILAQRKWPKKSVAIALAYAAEWGNVAAVRALLDHGAVADKRALASAAASAETTALLLDASGESPDVMVDGQPLLHLVANVGGEKAVRALLERGANVDKTSANGVTALHVCAHHGYVKVAKLLLERGARNDLATKAAWHDFAPRGATPLDVAKRQLRAQAGAKPWKDLVKLLA